MSTMNPFQEAATADSIWDHYRRFCENLFRTFFLGVLNIEKAGVDRGAEHFLEETLGRINEVLRIFSRANLSRSLSQFVEPILWSYPIRDRFDADRIYVIANLKTMIYNLDYQLDLAPIEPQKAFRLEDEQLIEALTLILEAALPTLANYGSQLDLLHEGDLWTPESIPPDLPLILEEISRDFLRSLATAPPLLYTISPRKFEELVGRLLEDQGFSVTLTPPTKDGGRDILAFIKLPVGEILTLVECKRWAIDRKVTVEPVRQLYGVLAAEKATNAMLATTSSFTADARMFVDSVRYQLSLKDYGDIKRWLQRYRS